MNVDHINPFVKSVGNVFRTMLDCPIKRDGVVLKEDPFPSYDVTAVIGLSGKICGSVVLSLSKEVALKVVETMLGSPVSEINADVADAVGELANMIAGGAKAELTQYELSLGLPNVIAGRNHKIFFPGNVRPLCIPLNTPWGPGSLEIGMDDGGAEDVAVEQTTEVCAAT